MYYRKYFSGTIPTASVSRRVNNIANGASFTHYYNQTDVLRSAIKQTLDDVGIQCEYGEIDGVLEIDGVTLQMLFYSISGNVYFFAHGLVLPNINEIFFNVTSYRFYITLKGDIDGILQVFIGTYNNPRNESYGFMIGNGVDIRDGTEIRAVFIGSITSSSSFYVLKGDRILEGYSSLVEFGGQLANVTQLNNNGTEVTLIECVAKPGRFKLNNCYFHNNCLTVGYFYNIGGDIYYSMVSNILVKCANSHAENS